MTRRDKCQIAELITEAIVRQGFRATTFPFRWARTWFGPWLDRSLPMDSLSRHEARAFGGILVLLLPVLIVALPLALPFEWARARRARLHNARTAPLLLASERRPCVAINYRIEKQGRAVFQGVALVATAGEGSELIGFCVHRGTPDAHALDAAALCRAMESRGRAAPEACHWQWEPNEPCELVERPARPW